MPSPPARAAAATAPRASLDDLSTSASPVGPYDSGDGVVVGGGGDDGGEISTLESHEHQHDRRVLCPCPLAGRHAWKNVQGRIGRFPGQSGSCTRAVD